MAVKQKIRIKVKSFDYEMLDQACVVIVDSAQRSGSEVGAIVPLPTQIKKITVNRSTFVNKDAREQYEMRTHRRLIDLVNVSPKTVDSLSNLLLPSVVGVEIKMM